MPGSKPFVIGLRGLAGAGKTTVSFFLQNKLAARQNCDAVKRSFATPIRQALEIMGIDKEEHPHVYRRAAQYLGTDIARKMLGEMWWVDQFQRWVNDIVLVGVDECNHNVKLYDHLFVVVDDVRFPNEHEVCDFVVFIEPEGFEAEDLRANAKHASETYNRSGPQGDPIVFNMKGKPEFAADEIISMLETAGLL